jgi:hypothetical protein
MKAKIKNPQDNGRNYGGEKELINAYSVVAVHKGRPVEAVTARAYMGRSRNASVVYASIWCRPADRNAAWAAGHGSAGGYGYHKESAAFDDAIMSAGIDLYGDVYGREDKPTKRASIAGVGESAMRDAFEAIARALGYRGQLVMVQH